MKKLLVLLVVLALVRTNSDNQSLGPNRNSAHEDGFSGFPIGARVVELVIRNDKAIRPSREKARVATGPGLFRSAPRVFAGLKAVTFSVNAGSLE